MTEKITAGIKSPEEILKQLGDEPLRLWTRNEVLKAMQVYHDQFKVSDEEIEKEFSRVVYHDKIDTITRNSILELLKRFRDRIFNK